MFRYFLYVFSAFVLMTAAGCSLANENPAAADTELPSSVSLPQVPIEIIFDDCDDNDNTNAWGGFWFTFNDGEIGGISEVEPKRGETFTMTATLNGGFNGKSLYAARIKADVKSSAADAEFVGIGILFNAAESPKDLRNIFDGFYFWYKVENASAPVKLRVSVKTADLDPSVTQLPSYEWTVSDTDMGQWKQIKIYWDDWLGCTYGCGDVDYDVSMTQAQALQFQTVSPVPWQGDIWFDNIVFFKE